MYKAYLADNNPQWDKTDFINAYQESENALAIMNSMLKYKEKPDFQAKHILDHAIKALTQNLSLDQIEIELKKLKPLIESYSEADLRLFKSTKPPKEKSEKHLDTVFKNIYNYDGKKINLVSLIDSIVSYHDVLNEEKKHVDTQVPSGKAR